KADAAAIMLRLTRVMRKIHPDVTITFEPEAAAPWFRGDESDLEEMAGNLLDNACKWAKGKVDVRLSAERSEKGSDLLLIRIGDDVPGLTEEEAQKVLRRGVRLDERTPGSGLGLDIVKELVDVYGGSLHLANSSLGGVMAELRLPTA